MNPYKEFLQKIAEIEELNQILGLLTWDQETVMPSGAIESRARQKATLSGITHEKFIDPYLGELAQSAEHEFGTKADLEIKANLREFWRQYDRATKIPKNLVEEITHTETKAHAVWAEARQKNDFKLFLPYLVKLIELRKQESANIAPDENPYDVQIEKFEVGVDSKEITVLFDRLKKGLLPLFQAIAGAEKKPNPSSLKGLFPAKKQKKLAREVAKKLGFDFTRGRLDSSVHPFCGGAGFQDVRITTRFNPKNFSEALSGIIHETGHGLYEQGLDAKRVYEPAGGARSMGVHESQSLLWEKHVGLSLEFWEYYFPRVQEIFAPALDHVRFKDFYFALNEVKPSFIRVDADEVTYPLHVILRFEIEQMIFASDLEPQDLPNIWNTKMKDYLGIQPAHDGEGVLQDVHWSAGLFGYFPTYNLGAIYASQLFKTAEKKISGLRGDFKKGDFSGLKNWLNREIHARGSLYETDELIQKATGDKINVEHHLDYLKEKYQALYDI